VAQPVMREDGYCCYPSVCLFFQMVRLSRFVKDYHMGLACSRNISYGMFHYLWVLCLAERSHNKHFVSVWSGLRSKKLVRLCGSGLQSFQCMMTGTYHLCRR